MPPADGRCTSFRHDEAFSPTLRSTLPSRWVARGPLPWWGAGLRGAVMSLLLILCRRAGCHCRRSLSRGAVVPNTILIKLSSPSLNSLLNMGSSLEAQQFMHPLRIDPTLNVASVATVNPCTVLLRASDLTTHRSMSMQVVARGSLLYGGGCTTNGEHWTPLPSLLSRGW